MSLKIKSMGNFFGETFLPVAQIIPTALQGRIQKSFIGPQPLKIQNLYNSSETKGLLKFFDKTSPLSNITSKNRTHHPSDEVEEIPLDECFWNFENLSESDKKICAQFEYDKVGQEIKNLRDLEEFPPKLKEFKVLQGLIDEFNLENGTSFVLKDIENFNFVIQYYQNFVYSIVMEIERPSETYAHLLAPKEERIKNLNEMMDNYIEENDGLYRLWLSVNEAVEKYSQENNDPRPIINSFGLNHVYSAASLDAIKSKLINRRKDLWLTWGCD